MTGEERNSAACQGFFLVLLKKNAPEEPVCRSRKHGPDLERDALMKKTVLFILTAACLAVSLAGCTGNRRPPVILINTPAKTASEATPVPSPQQSTIPTPTDTVPPTSAQTPAPTTPEPTSVDPPVLLPSDEPGPSDGKTYTGRSALPRVQFRVYDPSNYRKLSTKRVGHWFGASQYGERPKASLRFQKEFDQKGYDALTLDIKHTGNILYLTFDCGWENGYTGIILDVLKEKQVPAAFFCTLSQAKSSPQLIARMINEGHIVGNHSCKHPDYSTIDRVRMAQEIQTFDNYLRTNFGYTSPYFRFPYGAYTDSALELVSSLGYRSIFWSFAYEDWDVENQKGKEFAFRSVTTHLHPGGVFLLHSVSSDNASALGDIIDYARAQGYEFRSLDDYYRK